MTAEEIAARFQERCVLCFDPYSHLHHVLPRSAGEAANSDDNLVPLCLAHHDQVHREGAYSWIGDLRAARERALEIYVPK